MGVMAIETNKRSTIIRKVMTTESRREKWSSSEKESKEVSTIALGDHRPVVAILSLTIEDEMQTMLISLLFSQLVVEKSKPVSLVPISLQSMM